jgi:Cytochrome c554 and c-prime
MSPVPVAPAPAAPAPAARAPAATAPTPPATPAGLKPGGHLGVVSCSASNCHGDVNRPRGSSVAGNEYLIWSKADKHRNSFAVLTSAPALRIAKALGLPDAVSQKRCLDCHTDNVAADARGPQFHIEDGVGCEACHGGASSWLGTHISGQPRKVNLANGMYPTDQPIARAERCLDCHIGNGERFVDHRFYSAGHPRLGFELDTFSAIQPAHFNVDERYVQRKGNITDVQVWAVGQAAALQRRMDAFIDPKHAPRGMWPEFALLDCQTCHHQFGTIAGGSPGKFKLDDANALMVRVAAAWIAPESAQALDQHIAAMQRATIGNWAGVQREAAAVRDIADKLKQTFADHNFTSEDMRAIGGGLIALSGGGIGSSRNDQVAMGLRAVAASLRASGDLAPPQSEALDRAVKGVDAALTAVSGAHANASALIAALKNLQGTTRR